MVWFNIIFVIVLFVALAFVIEDYTGSGIPITIVIYILWFFVSVIFGDKTQLIEEWHEDDMIYTLEDNFVTTQDGEFRGSLFFVYGRTETEKGTYYTTMAGNDVNGYLIKQYDASKTYLFMDGADKPFIRTYYERHNVKAKWWTMFFSVNYEDKVVIKTELHIPKDSVSRDYKVDLK